MTGRAVAVGIVVGLGLGVFWFLWPRPHRVLDCQGGAGGCVMRELESALVDCDPWKPESCSQTREGLRKISYLADPLTQVSSPFTRELFSVEFSAVRLDRPWDLEFLPDGTMLITEKKGRIVLVRDGAVKTLRRIRPLVIAESGLLGLAVDPDFAKTRRVYAYYTHGWDKRRLGLAKAAPRRRVLNRISSFTLRDGRLTDETVLLDDIPGAAQHSGGRLEIGPDRKLYATTGDAVSAREAQDVAFLGGKVLRLNLDGSVPADNPFPESPVYSRGHRNPQGLAWGPAGDLFTCEHGPWRFDEINRVRPGGNYGWGAYSCEEKMPGIPESGRVTFPTVCFETWTAAPSGMVFVTDTGSPWYGSLFVAMLRGRHLHRYRFDGDEVVLDEIFFVSEGAAGTGGGRVVSRDPESDGIDLRIRDVEYHEGSLYLIGDAFGLVKITPL